MNEQMLSTHTIHTSLNKPDLLLGCERKLLVLSGLLTALIVISFNPITAVIGMLFWLIAIASLRKMAKADPLMSKIYLRHIKYQSYYPPHATPFAQSARHKR